MQASVNIYHQHILLLTESHQRALSACKRSATACSSLILLLSPADKPQSSCFCGERKGGRMEAAGKMKWAGIALGFLRKQNPRARFLFVCLFLNFQTLDAKSTCTPPHTHTHTYTHTNTHTHTHTKHPPPPHTHTYKQTKKRTKSILIQL